MNDAWGSSTFAMVYGLALVGASVTSVLLHPGPFIGVGASGAIFGILGALFALWVLGASELSPGFFLVNLTLNVAFAAREPNIDWAAHLGGFVVGIASIAVLDLVARINAWWLRCKFPEFLKMNTLLLAGCAVAWLWFHPLPRATGSDPHWPTLAASIVGLLLAIKLIDLLLSVRHGLAAIVGLLALSNGAAVYLAAAIVRSDAELRCRSVNDFGGHLDGVATILCPNLATATLASAGFAVLLSLAVHAKPLRRGWCDVGFVGATFMGDRQRERGLVRPIQHTRV